MLAKRIQHNDAHQHAAAPMIACLPKIDVVLRAKCLVTVMLIAGIAMLVTVRSEAIVRAGYDLVQLKSQALSVQRKNEVLQLEIAKLKSPQRIKTIATNELGMVMPQNVYCAELDVQKSERNVAKEKTVVNQLLTRLTGSKE